MNEKPVTLPSGGVAYIPEAMSYGQGRALRLHHHRINRYTGLVRNAEGEMVRGYRNDLSPAELDERDQLIEGTHPVYVRTLVTRWENVKDANGEELRLPDDVERMRDDDMTFLGLYLLNMRNRADPNASAASPTASSPPDSSPTTPTTPKTSAP